MKKYVFLLLSAILTILSFCFVYAGEKTALKDTPYYYEVDDESSCYNLYDSNGNIVYESSWDVIKSGGGNIIARFMDFGQRCGIVDINFNIILEPRFSQINYNENTKTYECLTWGEGKDKIEFFDLNIKQVSQPKDIRKLNDIDCYYERVLDENAEINDGYINYYICTKDGKRLVEDKYKSVDSVAGKIVVSTFNGITNTYENIDQLIAFSAASSWARESIRRAVNANIVPKELQSKYTEKITRDEFCHIATETYKRMTGNIYSTDKKYFTDTDKEYINNAYELGIVSGVGNNKFAPDNSITRQEAAVMLNNLAELVNITDINNSEKFIDEKYFANWAKDSIYSISNKGIMLGTEENKFSPWMNYTREQAIATMLRLYDYSKEEKIYDGQYGQPSNGEWLYYTNSNIQDNKINYEIVRAKKDGSKIETIFNTDNSLAVECITNEYIYFICHENNYNPNFYRMNIDGTEKTKITQNENDEAVNLFKKAIHNEKYKFYLKADWSSGMKSPDTYLTRSDIDGSNEVRLYDKAVFNNPILYNNNIYIIDFLNESETNEIIRLDIDGNYINLTENINHNIDEILKIENDRIYYISRSDNESLSKYNIYCMDIDGSSTKLLY